MQCGTTECSEQTTALTNIDTTTLHGLMQTIVYANNTPKMIFQRELDSIYNPPWYQVSASIVNTTVSCTVLQTSSEVDLSLINLPFTVNLLVSNNTDLSIATLQSIQVNQTDAASQLITFSLTSDEVTILLNSQFSMLQ